MPETSTAEPPVGRLAVVGLGLIGSSIARAARRYGLARTIVALDRDPAVRARVCELGIADVVTGNPAEGAADTDLVILCVPVGAIGAAAAELAPHLKPGAVVSDVGSVKGAVVAAIQPHLPDGVALERLVLEDLGDGRTRLTSTSLVDSFEGRDGFVASGMEVGVNEGYEKLEELLARS